MCEIPEAFQRGDTYRIIDREGDSYIYHGYRSKWWGPIDTEASFMAYAELELAQKVAHRLDKLQHKSVLRVHELVKRDRCYILVVDSLSKTYTLEAWLELEKAFWEISCDKKRIYGLEVDAQRFFSTLFDVLWMISMDDYHGNLLNGGLRVRCDNSVVLFNFAEYREEEYSNGNGLLKDLWDVKALVEKAVRMHNREKEGLVTPPVVKLFYDLYEYLKKGPTDVSLLRDPASIILNAPLAYDELQRYNFVRKVSELWHMSEADFIQVIEDGGHVTPIPINEKIKESSDDNDDVSASSSFIISTSTCSTSSTSQNSRRRQKKKISKGKLKKKGKEVDSSPTSASDMSANHGKKKRKQDDLDSTSEVDGASLHIPEFSCWQHFFLETKELYKVLTYHGKNAEGYYLQTPGIYCFLRHALEHSPIKKLKMSRKLYKACSDAVPRLFNFFNAKIQDHCLRLTGCTFAEFLRKEPYGFKADSKGGQPPRYKGFVSCSCSCSSRTKNVDQSAC